MRVYSGIGQLEHYTTWKLTMKTEAPQPDFVRTRKQTAEILTVSLRTLDGIKDLPRTRITQRRYGYRQSVIEKYLDARTGT
jgi:hypothetical protein